MNCLSHVIWISKDLKKLYQTKMSSMVLKDRYKLTNV